MGKFIVIFGVTLIAVYIEAVKETNQVEVRAVLISCELDAVGQSAQFDNEVMRFEREELFKHNALRDCHKKIALTVKITSEPGNSGDEYIPIEHVFQGPKKRVRLLNPYVLRLRRESPLQAYKLKKIDTVSGTLSKDIVNRRKRNLKSAASTAQNQQLKMEQHSTTEKTSQNGSCAEYMNIDLCLGRSKRHESNLDSIASGLNAKLNELMGALDETSHVALHNNMHEKSDNFNDISQPGEEMHLDDWKSGSEIISQNTKMPTQYNTKTKTDWPDLEEPNASDKLKQKHISTIGQDNEREYDMYEIGNADLWYTVQVQLFEKLSTPDGKIVWNDLTKGKPARVSSLSTEWKNSDMSIRYRSSEWIPRSQFTLPVTSMCLLAPAGNKTPAKNDDSVDQYILVPREDVVGLSIDGSGSKTDDQKAPTKRCEESHRRVMIRTSRALIGCVEDKVSIVPKGREQYLTMMHRQPHHAQLDLEARADANQLVYVGSFGRIMTVVVDSSRRTRTVLTVQATNTGLAAARFKVVARECSPGIPELLNDKANKKADDFMVLPPKYTQSILLEVSTEIPVDVAHCSVALINGDHESVAVRDVTIWKGDRCFCVWHCECVCLAEDPKLLCREMTESRQLAAGLSLRERTRHVRSVCYHDMVSLNLCFTAFGVITTLLLFGLVKAFLGLISRCIGFWGLPRIVQMPRKLDHYYETLLRDRKVVYDDEGWPVHPDTKERTVRLISMPIEFILNVIFFVSAPCVIIYDAMRQLFKYCKKSDATGSIRSANKNTKKIFSSHDIQSATTHCRRRRCKLQRWMTPEAENLSSNVLQEALPIRASMIRDYMRPLLHESYGRGEPGTPPVMVPELCGDSEVDDTEYVLMQMQKSRESLARSQRKLNVSVATTTKKQ